MSPDHCGNVVLIAKTCSKADDLLSQQPGRLAKAALLVRKSVKAVEDAYIKDVIQMVRNVDVDRLAPRRRSAVEHSLGCSTNRYMLLRGYAFSRKENKKAVFLLPKDSTTNPPSAVGRPRRHTHYPQKPMRGTITKTHTASP